MKPVSFSEVEQAHLALTQFHRWCELVDRPYTEPYLSRLLSLLAEDVQVQTSNGNFKGHQQFQERLALYTGWQNAHHVEYAAVTPLAEDALSLVAHVRFQNLRPDGSQHSYLLQYEGQLALRPGELPVFTALKLVPSGGVNDDAFQEAYPTNRVAAVIHYWLYCMETHNGDASQLRELAATEFEYHLATGGPVTTWDKFAAWVESMPSRIRHSSNHMHSLRVTNHHDGTFSASFVLDWQGISADGQPMVAEMQHHWVLEDLPQQRFAAIKKVRVETLQPFQISS